MESKSQEKMGFGINRDQLNNGYGLASNLFGLESLDLKSFFDNSNMDTMLYYNDRCFSPDCRYYYIKSVDSLKFYFSRNNKLLIAEKSNENYTINWNNNLLVFTAEITDHLYVLYRISLQNDTIHYYREHFYYVNFLGEINNRFAYDFRTSISDNSSYLHRDNLIIADENRLLLFPKDSILNKLVYYNQLFKTNFNFVDIVSYTDDIKIFWKRDSLLYENGDTKYFNNKSIIFKDSNYYDISSKLILRSHDGMFIYNKNLYSIVTPCSFKIQDNIDFSLIYFDGDKIVKVFTLTLPNALNYISSYKFYNNYLILQILHPDESLYYNTESDEYMDYCVLFFDLEKSEFVKTPIIKIVE